MVASALVLLLLMATVEAGPDDAGLGPLVGLVVGPDGQPAPGSEVMASGGAWDGEVPALLGRTTTDAEGRFVLTLSGDPDGHDRPTLWAYRPGSVASSSPIDRDAKRGVPVRLALGAPTQAAFAVAGPDARPVAGARIAPRRLGHEGLDVPEALAMLAGATTDAVGRAVVTAFRPEELAVVAVESAGFGVQTRDFTSRGSQADVGTKSISLLATGKVSGRVVAEDPKAVAGLTVRLSTADGRHPLGTAETTTDESGRFAVEAIAAGGLTVRVRPRAGSPDLPARVIRRLLEPGGNALVEIPLRRGVRVFGKARDDRDGQPIAGVMVAVVPSGPAETARVRTDPKGEYEAYVPAGTVTHRVLKVPEAYLCPPSFLGPRPIEVPPAIVGLELPPITLTRGVEVRGSVADEDERASGGAKVEATWTLFDGRVRVPRSASARTRPDGSFVLGPVDPDAELSLVASAGLESTAEPVAARASDARPILLTIVEPDAVAPVGRVVDAEGRPVAGASVRIWSLARSGADPVRGGTLVHFDGKDELKTDAEGRFHGSRRLRRDRNYRALASADRSLPGRTPPLRPGSRDTLTFPDIVLAREPRRVVVEGRVLDRQGRPVAGASFRTSCEGPSRRHAVTDADGRFRLEDVAEGHAFLFAERSGFRFFGRAIDAGHGTFDVVMTRLDETPDTSMTTRPIAPAGLGLARQMMAPYVDRVLRHGDHATRVRTLELLARIDPKRVLALIEERKVEDAWFADHLRHAAARGLFGSSIDEALGAVEAIRDGEWRVLGYLEAAAALPEAARAQKHVWVDRALGDARTIREPARRAVALARVAGRLIDLGELDRANRLLDETRPIAEALPVATSGGRARGAFAEYLAHFDSARALALTEDLVDPDAFDGCRLKIARALAGRDPALAVRIVATLRDPRSLGRALPELCHAMAPIDPARARKLLTDAGAGAGEPCLPPYALGMMALAIASTDKPTATHWLREAFDLLGDLATAGPPSPGASHDPAAVAAALLPVAERIDPKLVPELFWRALSFHAPRPVAGVRGDAVLALLLARYDLSVARSLLGPLTDRALKAPDGDLRPLIAAAAILDPGLAVRLVNELPDAPDLTFHHPKNQARLALADALARGAPACWNHAVRQFLHLWTVGEPEME